jgi:hypothetical protein
MDFGLAFSYVFKDKDWLKKIAILSLVGLIPIIGQMIIFGMGMQIARRVMNQDPNPLPDLDFAGDLTRGFLSSVISFVYTLPVTLIVIFFSILDAAFSFSSSNQGGNAGYIILTLCLSLFAVVYAIFIAMVTPAALTRYLENESLGAAFDFGAVFKMVQLNLGAYFIVLLGTIVAWLISGLGLIACIIGVMLTYTYAIAVIGHFYGQAHLEATSSKMIVDVPPAASKKS